MGLACLLLNRIHTKRHEHDAPIHDLARSGAGLDAPPDRAHPAAPPSPRLSANRGCAPDCWCAAFPEGRHRSGSHESRSWTYHPWRERIMQTTTTTNTGPAIPLRREGDVTSPSINNAGPRMVRLTVNLPSQLVEQMRDAVYWTPGLTLAWMIARAVRASLTDLEIVHQGPFPRRLKPLRAGRPRRIGQSMHLRPIESAGGPDVPNTPTPVVTKTEATSLKAR